MDNEELQLPVEIPWKLASTTQPLQIDGPAETTISLFFHEPDDELLNDKLNGEKLVYFKIIASISPCALNEVDTSLAAAFLADNLPVLNVQLDLNITPGSGETGDIRPYFHAAAPLKRQMIETGVVGNELIEGESDGQFFGKSGSHLYENSRSRAITNTSSSGFGIPGIGGVSSQSSRTGVSSERNVDQVVDTTSREASEERRELVSHFTNVENILTLLSTKYVGTPYLRFSLFPRPLQLLSIDPADPNLWFNQLLRHRSSGIEGIQEFTAVALVPSEQDFCVNASLRRVCLLDEPPTPPNFNERLIPDLFQVGRMVRYLYDRFPKGTPLDELDIDILEGITKADGTSNLNNLPRPVIRLWAFRLGAQVVEALIASPGPTAGQSTEDSANYKHFLEIWLETLRAEYEQELARSPLERGALLGEKRLLKTCFSPGEEGEFSVSESSSSTVPLVPVDFDDLVPEITVDTGAISVQSRAQETISRWNTLENKLNSFLFNLSDLPDASLPLENSKITNILINRWSKIVPDDPRNIPLEAVGEILGLSEAHSSTLEKAGVKNIRDIGVALAISRDITAQNREVEQYCGEQEGQSDACVIGNRVLIKPPEQIEYPVTEEKASRIRAAIAAGLKGQSSPRYKTRTRNRKKSGSKK